MHDEIVESRFAPFEQAMAAEKLPPVVIETFRYYYRQLTAGHSGYISEKDILPVDSLPDAEKFGREYSQSGGEAVSKTVIIKLNGGLGTSMGLNRAKSLIEVKDGLNFLDIIARQAINSRTPLVLMNSFVTRDDSLEILDRYPGLGEFGIARDFVQHKIPKIRQDNLQPAKWSGQPTLEWCPPGHGDIYLALHTSGILADMIGAGYEYAFISNADNLGACLDEDILGYFVKQGLAFLMEVADRTGMDRKGGHLARTPDGRWILRESGQCLEQDVENFQDINRHKFFNTNNLWLNLKELQHSLIARDYILGLPLICNSKNIDPRDTNSIPVYQLETAMGSAISVFDRSEAVRVPRTRFAPVKTTNDLFIIRSDAYGLSENFRLTPAGPVSGRLPMIELDKTYYRLIDDFEDRFAGGVPSILDCRKLTVTGDIKFGNNIKIEGEVTLTNQSETQALIEDNTVISEDISFG